MSTAMVECIEAAFFNSRSRGARISFRQAVPSLSGKTTHGERKLGEQRHARKPNQIIHADYLYVHKGYLLVLRDDLSSHIVL